VTIATAASFRPAQGFEPETGKAVANLLKLLCGAFAALFHSGACAGIETARQSRAVSHAASLGRAGLAASSEVYKR